MPKVTPRPDLDGKIRYTVILSPEGHKRLTTYTEKHNLSQADVLETLLEGAENDPVWADRFDKTRTNKVTGRVKKRQVIEQLAGLDPDTLAKLLEQARGQKAPA